jgi:hypothetical protein
LGIHINTVNSCWILSLHLIFDSTLRPYLDYNDPHEVSLHFNSLHRPPHTIISLSLHRYLFPKLLSSLPAPVHTPFFPSTSSVSYRASCRFYPFTSHASLPPIIASFYPFPLRVLSSLPHIPKEADTIAHNNHNGIRRTQEP